MWKTEKDFAKYIMGKMKDVGMTPVRVETPATVNGFPDLYVMGSTDDYFIEFKNKSTSSIQSKMWTIPWRPGQQGFALQYLVSHTKYIHSKYDGHMIQKHAWTFVGMRDGVLLIRMSRLHEKDKVSSNEPDVFVFTEDDMKHINLSYFLRTHTYSVTPMYTGNESLAMYINRAMKYYIESVHANPCCDIDYLMCEDYLTADTSDEDFWDREYSREDMAKMYGVFLPKIEQQAWNTYHTWLRTRRYCDI